MGAKFTQAIAVAATLSTAVFPSKANNRFSTESFGDQSRAIVLDRFVKPTVDLNHDGYPDVPHGQMVAASLASKGVSVVPIELGESLSISLAKLVKDIRNGKIEKSPINISIGYDVELASLGQIINVPNLNPFNLSDNLSKIRKVIAELSVKGDRNQIPVGHGKIRFNITTPELLSTLNSLRDLSELGCPVFVSAGNSGPKNINFLALAEGVTVVGNLTANGLRDPKSSFIEGRTIWKQGTHPMRLVSGGIDYTLDGKADTLPEEFPPNMKLSAASISEVRQRFVEGIKSLSNKDRPHIQSTILAKILQKAGLKTGTYSCEDFQQITGIPAKDRASFAVVFQESAARQAASFTFIKSQSGTSIASAHALFSSLNR